MESWAPEVSSKEKALTNPSETYDNKPADEGQSTVGNQPTRLIALPLVAQHKLPAYDGSNCTYYPGGQGEGRLVFHDQNHKPLCTLKPDHYEANMLLLQFANLPSEAAEVLQYSSAASGMCYLVPLPGCTLIRWDGLYPIVPLGLSLSQACKVMSTLPLEVTECVFSVMYVGEGEGKDGVLYVTSFICVREGDDLWIASADENEADTSAESSKIWQDISDEGVSSEVPGPTAEQLEDIAFDKQQYCEVGGFPILREGCIVPVSQQAAPPKE